MIRVAIVDDQPLLVSAFSALIDAQPDLSVALTAADGRQAVTALRAEPAVDLALMDLRMPVLSGVSAIRELRAAPETAGLRILVLTTFHEEDLVLSALRAGAHGFLLKDAEPQALLGAIRTVAGGGSWLDPAVTGTVLAHLDAPEPPPSRGPAGGAAPVVGVPGGPIEPLTGREAEVVRLVCQGLSNAAVAERLHVAESTVKTHVKAVLTKTGCRNRVELVIYALSTGLSP